MRFDYERDTRAHYQDDAVAETYHRAFASRGGLSGLRFRVVAAAERAAIRKMLERVPHEKVLDVPAGSGKLASVFSELESSVTACDVSASMLEIAKKEYRRAGVSSANFRVGDAADLEGFVSAEFDTVVSLRLLHRVPPSIRLTMLSEFARTAWYAVVSYGIETGFHRARRMVRSTIAGGRNDRLCYCSVEEAKSELGQSFEVLDCEWIRPFVSQEMVFLVKSKNAA